MMWECTLKAAELPDIVEMLLSNDEEDQRRATKRIRQWTCKNHPSIATIVETGTVRRFVEFLQMNCSLALQMDAAWTLINIAAGASEETKTVVDAGAVPVFIELLSSKSENLKDQAVWALGNIAGDCDEYRDLILDNGVMDPLLRMLNEAKKIVNAMWTLRSLCRMKSSRPDFAIVSRSLPTLSNLLFRCDSPAVLVDACWTIACLAYGSNDHVQSVIDAGVCERLVELLKHRFQNVVSAALVAIANIVCGDDNQTQVVLNYTTLLPALLHLLTNGSESVKKESCRTISNITAGTQSQIQEVIDANIIPVVINILDTAPKYKIKTEAAWVISNISSVGSADQIEFLVKSGCISVYCKLLSAVGKEIIPVLLEGLKNILSWGDEDAKNNGGVNRSVTMVKEFSGCERLLRIRSFYKQCDCHEIAENILKTYFEDEKYNLTTHVS